MRFIHETEKDGLLHGMAELLGTRSVRKIMEKEAGEHAEVDLPPYWHYLYEWLIKYYPYNGVAIFGGKSDFIGHLHYRLLTFVRKRNHTLYFSKSELTAAFLLEVFGATYYKEVLNAIYNMQPRHADGSPASDGYYNLQLYRVFMQLSLLTFSPGMNISVDETANESVSGGKTVSSLTDFSKENVIAFLKDARRSDADKRMLIATWVRQKPEAFISWLKSEVTDDGELIAISARLMDEKTWKRLLASTSLAALETVDEVMRYLAGLVKDNRLADGLSYEEEETLELMELLSYTGDSRVRHAMSAFEQWSQHIKVHSNSVQTLLENDWNTSDGFMEWLKCSEVTTESKRELLQALALEKPQELTVILRKLPQNEEAVSLTATCIPIEMLSGVVEKADAKQALLLSRTVDWLQKERGRFTFLSHTNLSFTTALSEAFLLFMQDEDTLGGRNLTELEVVGKFLEHLYYVYTRRTDYNDNKEWKHLQDEVTDGLGLGGKDTTAFPASEDATSERLPAEYSRLNDAELYQLAADVLDKEPEAFIAMLEKNSDTEFIRRISHVADRAMLRRMIIVLSSVSGLENPTAFLKLMEWLGIRSADRISASDMMSALLLWINTTDWKRQSVWQMTVFFLSRLYGSNDAANLPLEMLTDDVLPEEVRKRLFQNYMHSRPTALLEYIQRLFAQDKLPLKKWAEWADLPEWLELTVSLSLTLEEVLRQVIEYLVQSKLANEATLRYGVATYLAANDAVRFAYYVDKAEVVRSFVLSLPVMHKKTEGEKEDTVRQVMESLRITPEEEKILESDRKNELEVTLVGNAGLCLLSPWLPRLFALLGYLDEEKRNFKDTASRIRAVFLLQYLASPEEKDYREPELAFNRLLVALPAQVPLPKRVELTDGEKEMADNMLAGIKANWPKMDGTSVSGFRQSFILRDGRLEQQDERWQLTVESRVYDILLDAVPWSFRQIRFPWLKKYIQVSWHERQEF